MDIRSVILCMTASLGIAACNPAKKATLPAGDNSRNALDWSGTYHGVLPCAGCEGIPAQIRLNSDQTYSVVEKGGQENDRIQSSGTFDWDKNGARITLQRPDARLRVMSYAVGENVLIPLDRKGRITDTTADRRYSLRKDPGGLTEKYWKLTELNGRPVTIEGHSREPHMILKDEGARVHGNGGCNTFNGIYELKDGNRIRFSKMTSTMMACLDGGDVETRFHQVLEQADNYSLNGDTLTLNKARMSPLARFEAVYLR